MLYVCYISIVCYISNNGIDNKTTSLHGKYMVKYNLVYSNKCPMGFCSEINLVYSN